VAQRSRERFLENLRKITPPGLEPNSFAEEFRARYTDDDERVIGVRFGPRTIEVEITDATAGNDLPAAYQGVPLVLRHRVQRELTANQPATAQGPWSLPVQGWDVLSVMFSFHIDLYAWASARSASSAWPDPSACLIPTARS
jgi:hypothetical protein